MNCGFDLRNVREHCSSLSGQDSQESIKKQTLKYTQSHKGYLHHSADRLFEYERSWTAN